MLKQTDAEKSRRTIDPAAFGRLCVETEMRAGFVGIAPAAFGRLCVETYMTGFLHDTLEPAAFGRLCVETAELTEFNGEKVPAAFGRLCVETPNQTRRSSAYPQPPSGGCVLKPQPGLGKGCSFFTSRLRAAVC